MSKKASMADDILAVIREGTKRWTRTVKAEERSPQTRRYRYARMTQERGVQFKEAAEEIMERAYMEVSGNGALPAHARQIMYAARPHIQKVTGKPLIDSYFTQVLLPDYVAESPEAEDWDIVYDARGHFSEPHTDRSFGLGTLEVRAYLDDCHDPEIVAEEFKPAHVKTCGPSGNFGAVLFIEKEGFIPLFKAAHIAEKYDLAIKSTKGMSVVAARALADQMCSEHDIPLLLLHDFDKAGFSISGTLQRDTRRYTFENSIKVIDLGLTLKDVEEMSLQFEHQYHKESKEALMENMRENGASEEDIAFMFADWDNSETARCTRRVELNAMTSPQFLTFLERKLAEHGVEKVIPEGDLLNETYRAIAASRRREKIVAEVMAKAEPHDDDEPPGDLAEKVADYLKKNPTARWDEAVAAIIVPANEKAPVA